MILPVYGDMTIQAMAATKISKPVIKTVKETGNANVTITWKKSKGAKKYQVLRSTKKSGKGAKKLGTVKKAKLVDKNTKDGKTYYYSVKAINGKRSASSKWKKFKTSGAPVLGDLHSSVTSALENSDNSALVSVQVKNSKRLKTSGLSLVDDATGITIGELNDSGRNGDTIKGDGLYSLKINITGSVGDKKKYSVTYKNQKKSTDEIDFFDKITSEDILEASSSAAELADAAKEAVGGDTVISSSEAEKAIDAVYDKAQPLLSEGKAIYVGKTEDGVGIQLASGIRCLYEPHYADTDSSSTDDETLTSIGILPFWGDTSEENGNDYLAKLDDAYKNASQIADKVDNVKYGYTLYNPSATLQYIREAFKDNTIILWHGHGGYYNDVENGRDWGPTLVTDERTVDENHNVSATTQEWLNGIVISPDKEGARISITDDFIWENVSSMKNSFVYLGACHSMQDYRLAQAFKSKGASVIGYSNTVFTKYNEAMMEAISSYMSQENSETGKLYTLTEALDKAKKQVAENDCEYKRIPEKDRNDKKNDTKEGIAEPLYVLSDPINNYRFSNKSFEVERALSDYKDFYDKEYTERSEEYLSTAVSLVYIDNNDIPELVISQGADNEYCMPFFYTWYKGKIKSIDIDTMGTCYVKEYRYVEKKGYFTYMDLTHFGGRTYTELKNGSLKQLVYLFEDDAYGGGAHGGDQIKIENGKYKSITPSQYQAAVKKYDKKYMKNAKSITMYNSFDNALKAISK